jgi:hypothetical protein
MGKVLMFLLIVVLAFASLAGYVFLGIASTRCAKNVC